jgi:phage terminase large subunit-like protein
VAVYEAAFKDYTDRLAPGEVATVMVIAQDRKQDRNVMRYITGLLHSNSMMEQLILREQQESIELTNRTVIEAQSASSRSVRGYTVACVIADEIAFWRSDESANPDTEIISALRPAILVPSSRAGENPIVLGQYLVPSA